VIVAALRALGGDGLIAPKQGEAKGLAQGLASAHRSLRPHIGELAALAARLDSLPPPNARAQLERLRDMLEKELPPHEREEQRTADPLIGKMLKEEDPTGPLIQTHHEILEFDVPRLGSRIDAVLISGPAVFRIEFKCGESHHRLADCNQAWDYALDLKNFHAGSHEAIFSICVRDASSSCG
jgi:hypothetical protein